MQRNRVGPRVNRFAVRRRARINPAGFGPPLFAGPPPPEPVQPRPTPRRIPKSTENAVFQDIQNTLEVVVRDPTFMILVAIAAGLVIMHAGNIDDGPLAPFFPKDSKNHFVIWVRENVKKFFGFISFLPALYETPLRFRYFACIAIPIWIFVAPECKQTQYFLQAVLYYLFMKVKLDQSRFVLIIASGACYFLGLLFDPPKPVPPVSGSTTGPTIPSGVSF